MWSENRFTLFGIMLLEQRGVGVICRGDDN